MKVCVIGDIHGTMKWHDCYKKIKDNDNDCDKIIVCGDWFDPYDDISLDTMIERYHEFINDMNNDDRIISLIGNHDIDGYIIDGETNRTCRNRTSRKLISEEISSNLSNSYLVYKIGNWLFSHAGVSQDWFDSIEDGKNIILSNKKGWTSQELNDLCVFYPMDFSGYGNNSMQGCTWIRPQALINNHIEGYNQVVGHTRVNEITNLKVIDNSLDVDIWLVDNCGEPKYLTLEIEQCE